jgi:glutaredoxin-related protein
MARDIWFAFDPDDVEGPPIFDLSCQWCGNVEKTTDHLANFSNHICPDCEAANDYLEHKRIKNKKIIMEKTNTKLVHFTDLDQKDRYYLIIDNGAEVRQQEINHIEFKELKHAEESHYIVELVKLKDKYRLFDKEREEA